LKVIHSPFTVIDDVRSDRSLRAELGLCCGFASVLLFGFFYVEMSVMPTNQTLLGKTRLDERIGL